MILFLRSHLGKIIFWNAILFIAVKFALPQSAFNLASLLNTLPTYDSREVIQLTNEQRALNNLTPLKANAKLDLAASEKLNNMATVEYFAHVSPSGVTPWYWIGKYKYNYKVAGENLAIGFSTAREAVIAWMNSPSHRDNLLNKQYKDIGVAVKGVEIEGREGILIVQMFGTESNQPVASLPTKTAAPVPLVISPSPIAGINIETKEVVTVQHTTTDEITSKPVQVMPVQYKDTARATTTLGIINKVFSVYALIITGLSMIVFFFFERSRSVAFKASFNLTLFILSIVIPSSSIILEGLIF